MRPPRPSTLTAGNTTNDAGLGGTLALGLVPRGNDVESTYVPWALAGKIPGSTFSLSIGLDNSTLSFGPERDVANWWNPAEDSMGAWSFIIDGVAVDGQMAVIEEAPGPIIQTIAMNGTNPSATAGSVPGSSPAEIPPASPTVQPAKRQTTPATPAPAPATPAPTSASSPMPSTDLNGEPCIVACTLEYKFCMCGEGEMCRRHDASCRTCPFLECVRNGTSAETEDCIACPAIYRSCDCGPDEDCVRTLGSCKECEKVECRKRGSVTPADPQWEEEPEPTTTGSGTSPTGPFTSGTVPTEPKPLNCTNPVMCPAIYQMCGCRADETCVRRNACDRCEWLECHKPAEPFEDPNGRCVQCEQDQPECDCPRGTTCVREPRSCDDCGRVTCRNNSDPALRFSLSLDDEIAVSPQVATALLKLIPGMVAIGGGQEKRAPTATASTPGGSAGSSDANNTAVSATAPPRPQGKTYYSVPCNTTADITLVFPGANYTLAAKDWVVPRHDGCQAVLVMQDTSFQDMILGRPFLRTVRAAFRLNDTAKVAFSPRNGSTAGVSAMQGTSGACALGLSLVSVLVALVAVCVI